MVDHVVRTLLSRLRPLRIRWLALSILGINSLSACGQQSFDQKLEGMYRNTVPLIKPAALDSLQQQRPVVLLDTRTPEEYAVSHLPRARFVNYDTFDVAALSDVDKDAEVVVYCAVGYRSERVGEALQKAGYKHVKNLYGGIFAWKNAGHMVVNQQDQPTDSVHTYNRNWSKWLDRGTKVW